MTDRVYLYDSTLRDGAQTRGVDFSVVDKQDIAHELDKLGIDYIEGGWPGANPTDDEFFDKKPKLKASCLTAFGMTRKHGRSAKNDPTLAALLDTGTKAICIVGKSSTFQAQKALGVSTAENIKMISESIEYLASKGREVMFDAEHFFDGYKQNKKYTLECAKAAYDAGARWVVLCDTNGGTLPHEVEAIVREVAKIIPGKNLGIHCHNDTENAVANSLAAVRAGVRQVQGTLNGLGERCGNANLVSIIPSLMLKMGFKTGIKDLKQLTHVSRFLDEKLNRTPNIQAAYVGAAAFSHKGGLHVSAVAKDPSTYEHIAPELVGNNRTILVSDQAGKSNFVDRLDKLKIKYSDEALREFIREIKDLEKAGYAFDGADASFEILAMRRFAKLPEVFKLSSYRVLTERRINAKGAQITVSEATVKLTAKGKEISTVGEGNGPINALDKALRTALTPLYPKLGDTKLVDYKVRIITPGVGTKAIVRVLIETEDKKGRRWSTIGVSENVIDASYAAIAESIFYGLVK
jgi:2-isopropylmalate synthase